ncbi:MAG: hypothetical protein ACK5TI_00440, partial [bacterium]
MTFELHDTMMRPGEAPGRMHPSAPRRPMLIRSAYQDAASASAGCVADPVAVPDAASARAGACAWIEPSVAGVATASTGLAPASA